MALQFTTSYLQDSLSLFRYYKTLSERAMAQLSDEQLSIAIDDESNSIAVIVKHMAGNLRSRWADFLTSDGEKATRNRDMEFVDPPENRESLLGIWNEGWDLLFAALEPLADADLGRTVKIRGEAHSVLQAINRQLTHYAYHSGQIVFLAKHLNHGQWQTLTIPRNRSADFNRKVQTGEASQR